jgi:hypothetical protein
MTDPREHEKTEPPARKNWGEDSRAERHPDPPEPRAPAGEPSRRGKDKVDEESAASFPASDPPSFNPTKIG